MELGNIGTVEIPEGKTIYDVAGTNPMITTEDGEEMLLSQAINKINNGGN